MGPVNDDDSKRLDRKEMFAPSRKERRRIAKQRGIFKRPGLWQQVNRHSDVSGHRQPKVNLDN